MLCSTPVSMLLKAIVIALPAGAESERVENAMFCALIDSVVPLGGGGGGGGGGGAGVFVARGAGGFVGAGATVGCACGAVVAAAAGVAVSLAAGDGLVAAVAVVCAVPDGVAVFEPLPEPQAANDAALISTPAAKTVDAIRMGRCLSCAL
jgi:hypothetical protein